MFYSGGMIVGVVVGVIICVVIIVGVVVCIVKKNKCLRGVIIVLFNINIIGVIIGKKFMYLI